VLPYVESLLRRADAHVTLATVMPSGRPREERLGRAYLHSVADRLEAKGACADIATLAGDPAHEIVHAAIRGRYDLVAMCSRGKGGLKRLLLGSVTQEILRSSPLPILIVPPGRPAADIRKILVPLDGSERANKILGPVAEMAEAYGARAVLLTAVGQKSGNGAPTARELARGLSHAEKFLDAQGIRYDKITCLGKPAEEILAYAKIRKVQLIAIATHGRTGLERLRYGSVAEAILYEARYPLLVMRTAALPGAWAREMLECACEGRK
jgi:nucleotide-binding universal stress UspA family protein